jgi:hypothetical protein
VLWVRFGIALDCLGALVNVPSTEPQDGCAGSGACGPASGMFWVALGGTDNRMH